DPRDPAEGRRCRDTESLEGKMKETPGSPTISAKLERIAKLAREAPEMALTTLAHHIDLDWASRGIPSHTQGWRCKGIDGQSAELYAANLGGQPSLAAGTREVRHLPRTTSAAGPHPEGKRLGDETDRHSDLRG